MRLRGIVSTIESTGDGAKITLTNCREINAAEWREYCTITFKTTEQGSKPFRLGREVEVKVTAK